MRSLVAVKVSDMQLDTEHDKRCWVATVLFAYSD